MADIFDETPTSQLQSKWIWFVGLGVLLLVCGLIALGNLMLATVVSVYYVGMLMLFGGVTYLVHAFQVRGWDHVLFWTLSGLLYVFAGIAAFVNPILTSAALTLFLSLALVIAGVFRTWVGRRMKPAKGWGWIVASGVITALAGFGARLAGQQPLGPRPVPGRRSHCSGLDDDRLRPRHPQLKQWKAVSFLTRT
ncbi:uncharacterized membrane protein HdeD (DUF308 family) [Rhizobium aethiopicum]|uniref:Uncharacterized membrane protein HdeD (DUF308 family) n=1 Tax=Rhizobium aethiopicum TaxID=1138170 RepID=A0A7W6QCF8_9HYPH|nr:uncharacterized membrane protein HdeD (DUF308 family) [Rhizobium aethiopicum]MBB4582539.1 uncharacterized membrane protein HdeD (DUF308 family) [Rhizobium aethiopicum]